MTPGRFRKKPVVIEAMRFTGMNHVAIVEWFKEHGQPFEPSIEGIGIPTLEGTMLAGAGDWIIRGVQGEFYPCKADIFDATYESIHDE